MGIMFKTSSKQTLFMSYQEIKLVVFPRDDDIIYHEKTTSEELTEWMVT